MPKKTYDVSAALEIIQPGSQFAVRDNDTDQIEYVVWAPPPPTEAEIDAAGVTANANKTAREVEQANAKNELDSGPPPQSLPGLAARVQALEILMGLKTYT